MLEAGQITHQPVALSLWVQKVSNEGPESGGGTGGGGEGKRGEEGGGQAVPNSAVTFDML